MEQVLARASWPIHWGARSVRGLVRLWLDVWSERQALQRLDDRMLADIGITPEVAAREAARTPWDVPVGRISGH